MSATDTARTFTTTTSIRTAGSTSRSRSVPSAAALLLLGLQAACGSGSSSGGVPPPVCSSLHVTQQRSTLAPEDFQTPGLALPSGTQPVGIVLDRDGTS